MLFEFGAMNLRPFVARGAVECGVEAVSPVVNRPDRESVRHRTCTRGEKGIPGIRGAHRACVCCFAMAASLAAHAESATAASGVRTRNVKLSKR
jgi:hypothetical protein